MAVCDVDERRQFVFNPFGVDGGTTTLVPRVPPGAIKD